MKCVSYTQTIPWKNHKGELTIADQNQRIAEYLAEHKELNLQKKYSDRKNAENAGAAFDKMIDDGVERKFDCIIVASMYYCGPDFPAARQAIKDREWYGYAFGLPDRHPTVFYRGAVRCPHGVGLFPSGRVGNVWRVVV